MYVNEDRVSEQISKLETISESLIDISADLLSEASAAGETKPPAEDKIVAQALRAVNKAKSSLEKLI